MRDEVDARIVELTAEVARRSKAYNVLLSGHMNTLESGRDAIIALGGECDALDVMEANDPWLAETRNALKEGV
jgi:hypothetical protein